MTAIVEVGFGKQTGKITDLSSGLKHTQIAGGSAGNHTVTGIATGDQIIAIEHHTAGALPADLTAEFSITAANTINNTGGTDTSSDALIVWWLDRT